jgi:hypothetical protein
MDIGVLPRERAAGKNYTPAPARATGFSGDFVIGTRSVGSIPSEKCHSY